MDILCFKMQFPEDAASNEEMRKYNEESNEEISDKSQMRNVMLSFFFFFKGVGVVFFKAVNAMKGKSCENILAKEP